ncbi:dihydrodipicolinate synthase family protein [Kangiella sp. HZ709]|uniref:dihydrodipicolinate synthase family protein n=1 Tax=Kangiella sp. HZ709 TaxID=2666328 RepID=UPI0012B0B7A3|nr:dihydrodipicolinate synthase family protein [Kangiella sp. HZ709]MRX28578.1 dihydrodipicolinate synthase family protein [Kangiella sp. HZ709]
MNGERIFTGCMPALMTPCNEFGQPNFTSLVATAKDLIQQGMSSVVYCGSMGDWPLLSIEQRKLGVTKLVNAGISVIVGTGAQNTANAVELAQHAQNIGAKGLMVIPRLLSRTTVVSAQFSHFSAILKAANELPSVIYNSPYYGYETKSDLFFKLRKAHPNLVGFKEFGGAAAMTYAAENITSGDPDLSLMVGVDTQVLHGFVRCGADGAITGVGNALPKEILYFAALCHRAREGDAQALGFANELSDALSILSKFDEEPDLVLYYKRLMVLEGHKEYQYQLNSFDNLTVSQQSFVDSEWKRFRNWWKQWGGKNYLGD